MQKLLILSDADVEATCDGMSVLSRVCSDRFYFSVEKAKLLIDTGAELDTPSTKDGATPLMCALKVKNFEAAQLLINQGVDVNAARTSDGMTVLALAVLDEEVDYDTIQLLLEKGANVNTANSKGITPLMYACMKGHLEVAWLLIDKGANVNALASRSTTALMYASSGDRKKKLAVVQLLLSKGADKKVKNHLGQTAFQQATLPEIKNALK